MKRRWWTLSALGLYLALPYALVQGLNLGLLREGRRARRELALTFDDGPDPATTPAVLDALKASGAQATFFVLADRAEAHPELVRRMLTEGHEVEAHAERHRHAWIRSPWGAFRDPGGAARRIAAVKGSPVTRHRPPHGAYTLATWLGQRAAGLRGTHWSLEGQDWRGDRTPAQVRERLERLVVPGAVIVLHDAGPGARNTVPLLPDLLAHLKARGYRLRTLSDLDGLEPVGGAALKRRAILAVDAAYDRLGRIFPAGGRADNLFRVARVAFPQRGVTLKDGTPVPFGTPAAEFHVNNPQLVDTGPRAALRQAALDFREVALDLERCPELRGAQVVFCLSSLGPLLDIRGFENHPLPQGAQRQRLHWWATVLRRAYGSDPDARPTTLSILSRADFLRLYGPDGDRSEKSGAR